MDTPPGGKKDISSPASKKESTTASGAKLLDTLKKHLIELSEPLVPGSKTRNSRQVCQSLNELTVNVIQKLLLSPQSNAQLLPNTIELLVYAYANVDQSIRLAASENLHKLLKALMGSQLFKLQQGLFHELKKNGSARSLCVVLECFSSLFSRTRPQKCSSLSQQLVPVLVRIFARPEEVIHENLIESLGKILPTMTPFLTSPQVQSLMSELLEQLQQSSSASYRRMMASAIDLLCVHSKAPPTKSNWIINKLILLASTPTSSQHIIQGVLLSLLNLLQHSKIVEPSTDILKQIYSLALSASKFGDHNTSNIALEVIEHTLRSCTPDFYSFMTTPLTPPTCVHNIWTSDTFDSFEEKSRGGGDNESLLEPPCDDYFEVDSETFEESSNQSEPLTSSTPSRSIKSGHASSSSSLGSWVVPLISTDTGYLIKCGEGCSTIPIEDLMIFIANTILGHSRVSVQSIGLSVTSVCVLLYPQCLADINSQLESFLDSDDPKLVSRMSQVLAQLIAAELRVQRGHFELCRPIVGVACEKISTILTSDSPVVLKAACESLRVCLLPLLSSTHPHKAVRLLEQLMKLTDVNYWLLKVELLQTLAVIDYAQLAILSPLLLPKILEGVVIPLLSDSDHRVRGAVCTTLVQLAKSLDHTSNHLLSLSQQHARISYNHLQIVNAQLSLAGIGRVESQCNPIIPTCLEYIVWECNVGLGCSDDHWRQKGSLEGLCVLADVYPPPTLPLMWEVSGSECAILEMTLQLLRGSWLSWQVATHHQLLQLSTTLFLACALDSLNQAASEGRGWEGGAERVGVVRHSTTLLLHVMKVLSIFHHVIEGKDPEEKEKKVIVKKIENFAKSSSDHTPQTHAPPIKEAIGSFVTNPHYLKLYHAVNAAYTNYKVSIDPNDEDKFTSFLSQVHECLASVFEVSLAEEVGRHVEEIMIYLSATIRVDAPGSLLCLQQIVNALFGMNVATQQTHLYSPFLSSLPYILETPPISPPTNSLVECLITAPLKQMKICLHAPPPTTPLTPTEDSNLPIKKKKGKMWLFGAKKNLVLKPLNPLSSIKNYLQHFEPLVIAAIQLFSNTSSLLTQERVLFMMVQLLHLKVRYDLLDCNKSFFDSVNRLLSLMETGSVKGGAQLVPHLFQFLVMLARDQSNIINIPEVMQKCDAVMASGQNMVSFAIPALQPLVLDLFVRPNLSKASELTTMREVALNMLLRLVEYPRVIQLLISVLESYQTNGQEWNTISSLIFAALLAPLGRLQTQLDSPSSVSALHQLLATMTPSAISIQGLMLALTKQTYVNSLTGITRWLAILSTILRLTVVIFPEDTLLHRLENIAMTTPSVECFGVAMPTVTWPEGMDSGKTVVRFSQFIMESLSLGVSCLSQLLWQTLKDTSENVLLPMVLSDILLLLQTLVKDGYPQLCDTLSRLSLPLPLLEGLVNVSHYYPVLPLHFTSLLITCKGMDNINQWMKYLFDSLKGELMVTQQLILHCSFMLLSSCDQLVNMMTPELLIELVKTTDHGNDFIKKLSQQSDEFKTSFFSLLSSLCSNSLIDSMKVLSILRYLGNDSHGNMARHIIDLIKNQFLNHPIKVIADSSMEIMNQLLTTTELTGDDVQPIILTAPSIETRCPSLWKKLTSVDMTTTSKEEEKHIITDDPLGAAVSNIPNMVTTVDKDWQKELILQSLPHLSSYSLIELLLVLDKYRMEEILNHTHFNPSLLEECVVQGIFQTLTKRNTILPLTEYSAMPTVTPPILSEDLLVVSVSCLLKHIQNWLESYTKEVEKEIHVEDKDGKEVEKEIHVEDKDGKEVEKEIHVEDKDGKEVEKVIHVEDKDGKEVEKEIEEMEVKKEEEQSKETKGDDKIINENEKQTAKEIIINDKNLSYFTRGLVWFLIGRTQFSFDIELTNQIASRLIQFTGKVLTLVCTQLPHYDIILMESILDCCSLILQTEDLVAIVTDEWVQLVTSHLTKIIEFEYEMNFELPVSHNSQSVAVHQLNWIVTFLSSSFIQPTEISSALKGLTFTLARHPFFSPSIFLPPLLTSMGGGVVTVQILDQSLADSDVLQEYMQRSNLIGWTTRSQFEELWMQLLGVLNTPIPDDEMPREELIAYNISLCSGVRAATSLLISTILRPCPGNPTASVPMHTHRIKDFNFLSTPAGKKLLPHRVTIESRILKTTAFQSHRHAHYQLPLMSDTQASTYPPVYSQNLERPLGYMDLTPCQLSYASLVPIILRTDVSSGSSPVSISEVDTRSCIMSLIELYTHLLSQPIDMLLLHHILTSIVMISDLFVLSNQYKWMLETFLKLSETHPSEDVLSEALLVLGIIKSAAVLRIESSNDIERIGKLVETSLGQDSFIITQNACLEGLLYVIEDNESKILPAISTVVAKYIQNHLSSYESYSEHHMLLVWTLATHLVLHGQFNKDLTFTGQLLELITLILSDSKVSCPFYQAITMGLEYMILSFSLSTNEKKSLRNLSAKRFVQSDHSKSLSTLSLLLTCMYTGEEADRLSGLSGPQDDMMALSESVYQSREHISNILERLRQGNETEVEFLIDILPGLIVDFLPRMDSMNMVVSEVVSQQQSRPWLAAHVMSKTFQLLLSKEMDPAITDKSGPTVTEWVLLSLDSFIQQEPEVHAVWSITCLLMAASTNLIIRSLFNVVAQRYSSINLEWLLNILCTVAYSFYRQENFPQEQKKLFLDKFDRSSYTSLHKLVHNLRN